jgi:hypothetical protein
MGENILASYLGLLGLLESTLLMFFLVVTTNSRLVATTIGTTTRG